jgi:hypothetical protein
MFLPFPLFSSPNIAGVIVMRGRRSAAGKAQKIFWLKTYCNISKSGNSSATPHTAAYPAS